MDRKKTKRRKSSASKRHGRSEEKPEKTEVMNEKEKQDRLDAASVLSSLMFLPPKSNNDDEISENNDRKDTVTPSKQVTQFSERPSTTGNPTTSRESKTRNAGGRDGINNDAATEFSVNMRNSLILAQLQSQLSIALQNKNVAPFYVKSSKANNLVTLQTAPSSSKDNLQIPTLATHLRSHLPLTVMPQTHTVNKQVAEALRIAVSNNRKAAQTPPKKAAEQNGEIPVTVKTSTATDVEKMEFDTVTSSRLKESTDTKLPLKKRRLVGVDDSIPTSELNLSSEMLQSNLTSAKQIENILQMAKDYPISPTNANINSLITGIPNKSLAKLSTEKGYRPVQFDPRTSLMVLSDLKFALTPDEDGDLPIHIAVVHENTELVKKFIDIMSISGKTVDRFNKLQQTPLHLAVLVNKPDIVMALLEAGANPNLLDRNGYTAVHICVNKQFVECLDTVFKHSKCDVNVNTKDYEGYPPLHTCVELNTLSILTTLVSRHADINCQDGKAGRSVLLYAVEYNRCDIVEYLLAEGADPELQNYASVTPLMTAQAGNMKEIVKHLNKALDLRPEDNQFNQSNKKVPLTRMLSRSSSVIKEEKPTRLPFGAEEVPLFYEEYEPMRSRSGSFSGEIKREPLSRQVSETSPIDLSIKRNTESPSGDNEPTIRGKPGRKRTKKESKNHKDKHSQKSVLKEKHASVVAALESTGKYMLKPSLGQLPYVSSGNGEHGMDDSPTKFKNEKQERKPCAKDEEMVDVETVAQRNESLNSFLMSLKPEDTKHLIEKVKEQFNIRFQLGMKLASDENDRAVKALSENEYAHDQSKELKKNEEQNIEAMQIDSKKTAVGGEDSEILHQPQPQIEKASMDKAASINSDENAENVIVSHNDNEHENMDSSETDSMPVLSRFTSLNEDDGRKSAQEKEMEGVTYSPAVLERQVTNNGEPSIESTQSSDFECSPTPDSNEETGKSSMNTSFKPLTKNDQNDKLPENETDANLETDGEKTVFNTSEPDGNEEKNTSKLETQSSQESSGNSQTSQGFESSECAMVTSKSAFETGNGVLDNSDESMEIELTGEMMKVVSCEGNDNENKRKDFKGSLTNETVENKIAMETDEDDEDKGLVIDEDLSGDEKPVNNVHRGKSKTKQGNRLSHMEQTHQLVGLGKGKELISNCKKLDKINGTTLKETVVTDKVKTKDKKSPKLVNESSRKVNASKVSSIDKNDKLTKNEDINKTKAVNEKGDKNANNLLKAVSPTQIVVSDVVKTVQQTELKPVQSNKTTLNMQTITNDTVTLQSSVISSSVDVSAVPPRLAVSDTKGTLLKQGQSHTLFYHDGDSFKPVKIFIDNSEQSSLVLQRMFQTAQLRQSGSSDALHNLKNLIKPNSAGMKLVTSNQTTAQMVSNSNVVDVNGSNGPSSNALTSPQKARVATVSVTGVRPSLIPVTSLRPMLPSYSLSNVKAKGSVRPTAEQNNPTVDMTANNVVTNSVKKHSNINAIIKPGPKLTLNAAQTSDTSNGSGSQVLQPGTLVTSLTNLTAPKKGLGTFNKPVGMFPLKTGQSSEGTLTRINPDVKSRLSLALKSTHRKFGLVHSDSEPCIVNSTSSSASEPVVSEARQQL